MNQTLIDPDFNPNQFPTWYIIVLWLFYPFRLILTFIALPFWIYEYFYWSKSNSYTSKNERNYALLFIVLVFNYLLYSSDVFVEFKLAEKVFITIASLLLCLGAIQLLNDGDIYHKNHV